MTLVIVRPAEIRAENICPALDETEEWTQLRKRLLKLRWMGLLPGTESLTRQYAREIYAIAAILELCRPF